MGNFSRNTFDPVKDYVAVRLQQGVPVLDADWNELNDVTRHELYENYNLTFTDGVRPNSTDLFPGAFFPPSSDFYVGPGTALVQGRIVHVRQQLYYSTQPWTNPQRAARDGVAVIPPLTTPVGADRTDVIYLDVWEREVGNAEDASLVNPAIGIETCVRLKREAAVRVTEGATTLPTNVPAGHVFLPLALLQRPVGEKRITNIKDIRPFFHSPQGIGVVSFFPGFLPIYSSPLATETTVPEWRITISPTGPSQAIPKFRALKRQNETASGILPLTLPDRARLRSFAISGDISAIGGVVQWTLMRFRHQVPTASSAESFFDILGEEVIQAAVPGHVFDKTSSLSGDESKLIVDNSRYNYALLTFTGMIAGGYTASIHGVSISYEYYGLAGPPTPHS